MRKLITVSVVLMLTGLFSCNDSTIVNPLAGTWQFSYEQYSNCNDPADDGKYDYACNSTTCFKYIFDDTNNYEYQALTNGTLSSQKGTYTVDNGKLTLCSGGCNDPVDFTISNSTLTIKYNDAQGCSIDRVLIKI